VALTVYYRDKSVRITSDVIEVQERSYPLEHLDQVWHQRGERSFRVLAGRGALAAAMIGPVVAGVIGVVIAIRLDASSTVTVALVGVSVLVGLTAGPLTDLLLNRMDDSYDRGTHDLEIWVTVRGRPVLLLRTRNALRFGQIYRAVQRAVERHGS
jgi:hypothetical protein